MVYEMKYIDRYYFTLGFLIYLIDAYIIYCGIITVTRVLYWDQMKFAFLGGQKTGTKTPQSFNKLIRVGSKRLRAVIGGSKSTMAGKEC